MATASRPLVVLDTHVALWWSADPKRLSARAAAAIAAADRLGVPTIVFWEVSLLLRKRKLALALPVAEWAEKLCRIPRVEPLPLTVELAILADSLPMHPDPADRFIVASAVIQKAQLITKDRLIRKLKLVRTIW
ncbi:MAG: PIN domain-containing protein [Myxococcales bacterium]|nr:PIN domain-containing protein [Myxococcales bacterium]